MNCPPSQKRKVSSYPAFSKRRKIAHDELQLPSGFFFLFVQEKIAMTPETKCVETIAVTLAAAIIVPANKKMFFETERVGKLPEYKQTI